MKALLCVKTFLSGYYNTLLCCLIILFVVRPDQRESVYHAIWKFFLTLTLLSAIFNTPRSRKLRAFSLFLAVPAIILSWVDLFFFQETLFVTNAVMTLVFMVVITSMVIYDVVRGKVTEEALRGVICAYFMVAFAFAYFYYLIGYLKPGSFSFSHFPQLTADSHAHYLSQMFYYSFVTLLQIGYGDITAVLNTAQTASIIEATFGQFYIAILVARLVAVYSARERSLY